MTLRVAVTGLGGFLGWHLFCHTLTRSDVEAVSVDPGDFVDSESLARRLSQADALIHLAGANRGPDDEVAQVNVDLARRVSAAVRRTASVRRLVYANTTKSLGESSYGESKREAGRILTEESGVHVADVLLPNLFGEHGRPDYNSFVATFCQRLATGEEPEVDSDAELDLLHAQDAARLLVDLAFESSPAGMVQPNGTPTSVGEVAAILGRQADQYASGLFPDLGSRFEARLFNQLRSYAQPFNEHSDRPTRFDSPRPLGVRSDARGGLVEIAKAMGGESQTFFSTTRPGVTRGNHFHTHKVERFVVVSGRAEIALRRVGTSKRHVFAVSGDRPAVVDIPSLHTHAITNVGDTELLTLFWTDAVFDPDSPDTYPESVEVVA